MQAARAIALPGGPPVRMDFVAYDAATRSLWVPAGNTARVDVIDVASFGVQSVEGFATKQIEAHGEQRTVGPSSAAVGDGVVYVGNRGDDSVCAIDARTHALGGCLSLGSMPDAMALVASAHELWVTTPRDKTIAVLHVDGTSAPTLLATIPFDGEPECAAVDAVHGLLYTNLEDLDRTVAVDVATRNVVATFSPGCGEEGPRGVAVDPARHQLYVACTNKVVSLDLAHGGAVLGSVATGDRLDDLAYSAERRMLYVASGGDATLRFVRVDDRGVLSVAATAPTAPGARNAVVDEGGRVYVTDSVGGRILVVDGL